MPDRASLRVGGLVELELGPMVPGGHCLARHGGRIVLVRHGLPGEEVQARVKAISSKVAFADVIEVRQASAQRVAPVCALVGRCGGCDLQHADRAAQLVLKAQIITDALRRQGGLEPVAIEALGIRVRPLDADGTGWRTSVRWHRDEVGRAGFRGWREHEVIPVASCPMLAPGLDAAMASEEGSTARLGTDGAIGTLDRPTVQQVGDRRWTIAAESFWQSHRDAPEALVAAVLEHARPRAGERWVDLYAGAGLFSAFLAEAVGAGGSVTAVESAASSVADGEQALADLPQVAFVRGDAGRWVPDGPLDGVVLDPPRTGATPELLAALAAVRPSRIVYVACDPVTFARDVRTLAASGYRLTRLDALDAFPMTHHVESIATLLPIGDEDKVS